MDRESLKILFAQALIQISIVTVLAMGSFAFNGCARKDTVPPGAQGSLSAQQLEALAKQQAAAAEAAEADAKAPYVTAKKIKNGDKLLALILKDQKMAAYRTEYERKNKVVCTRPSASQMHWDCKSPTECTFSMEFTCVSSVGEFSDNNEIRRVSLLGEGNSTKMTYKFLNPIETAIESRPQKVSFER